MPFDPYVIAEGEVVSVGGVLWTNLGSGPGEMFPSVTLQVEWTTPSSYTIVSNFPQTQDSREIAIQALRPSGWYDIWRGNEDELPATINTLGLTINDVRARYTLANDCEYFADGVVVCSPAEAETVIAAVPVSDRATIEGDSPETGDAYLIVSGATDGVWTTNTIQTWNGTGWTSTAVVAGEIIATEEVPTPSYWITPVGTSVPAQLFPGLVVVWDAFTGLYTITSEYPSVSQAYGRNIVIQATGSPESWVTVYTGKETSLVAGLVLDLGAINPVEARIIYTNGGCSEVSGGIPTPPFGQCGTVDVSYSLSQDCVANQFFVTANIISAINYPLAGIVATVDGVDQPIVPASVGLNVMGGFPSTSEVTLRIVNSFNDECNIESPLFTSPIFPEVDYTVLSAVDASFESSRNPTQAYLIVSNEFGLTGGWANNVGKIWNAGTYITPADTEVTFATTPGGPMGYWQMDSGTQVQVFPMIVAEYNTVTQVYTAMPSPIAPFMAASDIIVRYRCATGAYVTIYSGPIGSFADTSFTAPCDVAVVNGVVEYVIGCIISVPIEIVRYTPTGDPDPDFSVGGLNNLVIMLASQPDSKIVCGGSFTLYNATVANRLTRLNADGTLDTAYNAIVSDPGKIVPGFNQRVSAVALQTDGFTLVGGDFTTLNDVAIGYITRLDADGNVDGAFNSGTGFNGPVSAIALQSDGRIVVTGAFTSYNGTAASRIIRLNPTGTVDPSFVTGTGFNSTAGDLTILPDGRIVVSNGFFTSYNGNTTTSPTAKSIVLIGPNGAFLSTIARGTQFNHSTLAPSIFATELLPDGSLIVTGQFNTYNGSPVNNIAKISLTGVLDASFQANLGSGFSGYVTRAAVMPNGQLIVGQLNASNTFSGLPTFGLVALNSNGTRDTAFNAGPGFNGSTYDVSISPNGSLVVGGLFTTLDGLSRLRVAKLQ